MNYRYPGPSPFTSNQEDVFYGREKDAEQLYNSILLNNCTVLVGKSGVGKTSLLNANLIPKFQLKNETSTGSDKRHFVIIKLTVGPWFPQSENQQYKRLITKIADRAKDQLGILDERRFLPFLQEGDINSIGYELKQYQFEYFQKRKNIIFFIILDQVEELFTYPYEEFKELIDEIKEILSPNLPETARERIESVEQNNPELISQDENAVLYTQLHIKFLFSIRVDKLGLLIRFKEAIPQIFSNPFELRPFSKQQAFEAIKLPAEKRGEFISQPFTIADETVYKIVDYLHNLPNSDLENSFDDLKIDPISLQLVCQYIELKIAPYDDDRLIQVHEVKKLEDIFGNYYMDILSKIGCEENELRKVRILIEEKLIYEPDKRRRQIFYDECNVDMKIMQSLVRLKLLREVIFGSRKSYYEVAHDWMILPILLAKEARLSEEAKLREQRVATILRSTYEETGEDGEYTSNYAKADYYFENKEYENAISYYTKYLRGLNENDKEAAIEPAIFLKRGESFHKIKQYEKSITDLELFIAKSGEDAMARFYLGFNFHMLYQLSEAKLNYELVLKIDNAHLNAYYNLGMVYQELGMLHDSLRMFDELTKLSSSDSDTWYNAGVISNKLSFFEKGIAYLQESVRINSGKIDAYNELAYAYSQTENYESAIKYYYQVYNSNNTNITAINQIKRLSQLTNNKIETRKADLILISSENDDPKVLFDLGDIELERLNYTEALNYYNRAIQLNEFYMDAYLRKIEISRSLHNENELLHNLQEIVKKGYNDVIIFLELGDRFMEKGELHSALFYYDKAFTADHNNLQFNIQYAKILVQNNDLDKALTVLEVSRNIDPENLTVLEMIGDIHLNREEFMSAREFLTKVLEISEETNLAPQQLVELKYKLSNLPSIQAAYEKAEKNYNDLQRTIAAIRGKK